LGDLRFLIFDLRLQENRAWSLNVDMKAQRIAGHSMAAVLVAFWIGLVSIQAGEPQSENKGKSAAAKVAAVGPQDTISTALQSELEKFRLAKPSVVSVLKLANELRDAELQSSSSMSERLFAIDRHFARLQEFEKEVTDRFEKGGVDSLSWNQVREARENAQTDLECTLQEYTSDQERQLQEAMKQRRARRARRTPDTKYGLIYPTFPPKIISK